ncbi:MAG: hypothetical protein ACRBF0_22900 [Calditrichia bacterium]
MLSFFKKKKAEAEAEERITIVAQVIHDSPRAILVEYKELNAWLPHSKIEIEELSADNEVRLNMSPRLFRVKFGGRD